MVRLRDGRIVEERRLPWLERALGRTIVTWRRRKLARYRGQRSTRR